MPGGFPFMDNEKNFNQCPNCSFTWKSREKFLNDADISLIGYQASFKELTAGSFLFNHSCKTTMGIAVSFFTDLYDGPVFQTRATGTAECPGLCLHQDNLNPCPVKCECAFVRKIIQKIKKPE
jgi:hypothetical protein